MNRCQCKCGCEAPILLHPKRRMCDYCSVEAYYKNPDHGPKGEK